MRGGLRLSPHHIFGPSSAGGHSSLFQQGEGLNDLRLFQRGEGLGDIFSSLFEKIIPAAKRTVKNIATSKIVKEGGKHLLNSAIDVATNVAVDALEGNRPIKESLDDNLTVAKRSIASSIRNSNKRKLLEASSELDNTPRKKSRKVKKKSTFSVNKRGQRGRGFNLFHDE